MLLYLLYSVTIFSVLMMVSRMNPIHSVISFILIFSSASAIFIFMHADFLGLVFLMVYVGAIAVSFIFVVMMLNVRKLERDTTTYLPIGGFSFMLFTMQLIYVIMSSYTIYSPYNITFGNTLLYDILSNSDEFVTKYVVQLIGISIFTEYPVVSSISGTTLSVSPIGSVYLTNIKTGYSLRRQDFQYRRKSNIYNIHVYQLVNTQHNLTDSLPSLGAHIGHLSVEAYQSMSYYVIGTRSDFAVIDLKKTVPMLKSALIFMERIIYNYGHASYSYSGITTLNMNSRVFLMHITTSRNQAYSHWRWVSGCITNYRVVFLRLVRYMYRNAHARWSRRRRLASTKMFSYSASDKVFFDNVICALPRHTDQRHLISILSRYRRFFRRGRKGIGSFIQIYGNAYRKSFNYNDLWPRTRKEIDLKERLAKRELLLALLRRIKEQRMWLLLGCVHVHTSGACKTLITRLARDVNANVGDDIRYDDDTVDESSDDSVSSNAVSSAVRFVRSYTSKRRIHQKGSNVFNYLYTKTMTELSRISLLKNHVSYRQIQQDYWKWGSLYGISRMIGRFAYRYIITGCTKYARACARKMFRLRRRIRRDTFYCKRSIPVKKLHLHTSNSLIIPENDMTGGKQHKGWNTNKGAQWNKYTNGGNGNKGRTYVRDNNNVIYNNANKGNKYNIGKSYDTVHKYVTNNRVKTEGRVNNVYKKYTYTGSETYKGKKDNKWNNIRSKYDKGPSYNKGNKDTHGTQPLNINTATENVKAKDKDATGDINTQWHVQRIESTLGFFDAKSGSDLHDIFYPTEILHRSIPKIRTMQNVFTDDVFLKRWYRASSGYRHVTHLPLRQRYRLTAYSDVGKVARPLWFDTTSLNERMNNYGIYKKHFFETKEGNNYLYYLRYGDYHRYSGRSKALTERNRLLYTGQLARSQIPFRQSSVFRTLPSFLSMFVRISYITKIKFEEFVSANDNADEDIYFKSVYRRFKSFRRAIISFKCFKKTANVPDRLVLVNPHSSLSQLRDFTGIYLPIISISDTATDPFRITYPIPSNDDSLIPLLFYFAIFPNACDAGITNRYIQFY